MSAPLPFVMTPEAAEYIRFRLRSQNAGEELALISVLKQGEVADGEEQIWFEGEHFMVCTYNVGRRPHALHIELFGRQVSVVPATLQSLSGRTLTVRRVVDRRGGNATRNVLVAT